jgi:predicted MFS family arabinose efflux permease
VTTGLALTVGPLLGAVLARELGTRTALILIGGLQMAATAFFLLLPNREQEAKLYAQEPAV